MIFGLKPKTFRLVVVFSIEHILATLAGKIEGENHDGAV